MNKLFISAALFAAHAACADEVSMSFGHVSHGNQLSSIEYKIEPYTLAPFSLLLSATDWGSVHSSIDNTHFDAPVKSLSIGGAYTYLQSDNWKAAVNVNVHSSLTEIKYVDDQHTWSLSERYRLFATVSSRFTYQINSKWGVELNIGRAIFNQPIASSNYYSLGLAYAFGNAKTKPYKAQQSIRPKPTTKPRPNSASTRQEETSASLDVAVIKPVPKPTPQTNQRLVIIGEGKIGFKCFQVGAFKSLENAELAKQQATANGFDTQIHDTPFYLKVIIRVDAIMQPTVLAKFNDAIEVDCSELLQSHNH